jgi:hypothetical protein
VARFLLAPSVALPRVARFLLAPSVALPRVARLPHSSSCTQDSNLELCADSRLGMISPFFRYVFIFTIKLLGHSITNMDRSKNKANRFELRKVYFIFHFRTHQAPQSFHI